MKNRSSILPRLFGFLLFVLPAVCFAQEPETYGFLNIVNLIPGEKPCDIVLTGKTLVPGGLAATTASGWFLVPPGNLSISLGMEGFDKASGNIDLAAMQSSIIVIFLEAPPASKNELNKDNAPRPKLKLKRFEIFGDTSTYALKLASLCPGENKFSVGPNPFDIKLYSSLDVPKWTGGGFQVSKAGSVVGSIPQQYEKGPYYLFVGTDHADKYCAVAVSAEKQDLPEGIRNRIKEQKANNNSSTPKKPTPP